MNTALLILVILLAPMIYFAVGYPLAAWLKRPRFASVIGLGITGWACEWIIMAQLPVWLPLGTMGIVAILGWRKVGVAGAADQIRECYAIYAWPLAAVLLTPFPGMGVWSTDWLYIYQTGQAVMGHLPYGGPMLERPPLGGASCIPLWLIANGMPTFQVWSAVTSMALVLVAMELYRELGGTRQGLLVWVPLLASCFFLQHTMLGWAKFLAAGLTLSGLLLMYRVAREHDWRAWIAGSGLFALAVATHQSAILYGPFVLLFGVQISRLRATLVRLGICLAMGLLIVLPFELWTIHTFGFDAKVNANPALAQRNPNEPGAVRALFMLISTVLPWNTLEDAARCFLEGVSGETLYWLATGVLTALAGTLLGSALPFLPLRNSPAVNRPWLVPLKSRGFLGCVLLAIVANALLSPYYAKWGSAQTGVVPIQVLLYVVLIRFVDDAGERTRRQVNVLALLLGIVPYALLAIGMTVWLQGTPSAHATFLTWDDNDYKKLFDHVDGRSLAFALYPIGPLFAGGLGLLLCVTQFGLRQPPANNCSPPTGE